MVSVITIITVLGGERGANYRVERQEAPDGDALRRLTAQKMIAPKHATSYILTNKINVRFLGLDGALVKLYILLNGNLGARSLRINSRSSARH